MAASSFDQRLFRPPDAFIGKPEEFEDFEYKFVSFMSLSDPNFADLLDQAAKKQEPIEDQDLTLGEAISDAVLQQRVSASRKLHITLSTLSAEYSQVCYFNEWL